MKALRIVVAVMAMSTMLIAQDVPKEAPKPAKSYQVEFTFTELEDGKKINTRTYTARVVGQGDRLNIRQGLRVPVTTGSKGGDSTVQYLDIGLSINGKINDQDRGQASPPYFSGVFEMSGLAPQDEQSRVAPNGPPMMRSMSYNLSSAFTPGRSVRLLDVDESDSKRRLQIDMLVTMGS